MLKGLRNSLALCLLTPLVALATADITQNLGTTITASVAAQIEGMSLMVVAYTSPSGFTSIGMVCLVDPV